MRRSKVTTAQPPVDRSSVLTRERLYTVTLGNRTVLRFPSERRALEFQAQATRFLTDTLMTANLLLIDAFAAYRCAWPYLDFERKAKGDVNCAELVRSAERSLDLASSDSNTVNATYFRWKHVGDALASIRTMSLQLERMYAEKSQGVHRHAMLVLAKRCRELADELAHFGADVDTAT